MIAQETVWVVFKTLFKTALICFVSLFLVVYVDLQISVSRVSAVMSQANSKLSAQNYLSVADITAVNDNLKRIVDKSSTLYSCVLTNVYDSESARVASASELSDRVQRGNIACLRFELCTKNRLFPLITMGDGFTVQTVNSDGTVSAANGSFNPDTMYDSASKTPGNVYALYTEAYCIRSLKE